MKRHTSGAISLILALALMLPIFSSCQSEGKESKNTEAGTEINRPQRPEEITPPIDDDDPDAEIKRLYYSAFTGSSEGALVLNDGVAYAGQFAPYLVRGKNATAFSYEKTIKHSELRITYFDKNRKLVPFCQVVGCAHDVPWCVSFARHVENAMIDYNILFPCLIVEPESEPDECRLYAIYVGRTTVPGGTFGISRDWKAYDPQNSSGDSSITVLFEYDLKRGTRRAVLPQPLIGENIDQVDLYYNGMIYCSRMGIDGKSTVLCVDNATGEYTLFQYKTYVRAVGVYDGRVIITASDGSVFSCSTELKERKLITKLEHTSNLSQMCGEKLLTVVPSGDSEDIYVADLSSPSPTQTVVAKNIDSLYTYGKYLYYLLKDSREYEFQGETYDMGCDGKLYRYDTETGGYETVCDKIVEGGKYLDIVYADDKIVAVSVTDPVFTEDTEKYDLEHYADASLTSGKIYYDAQIEYDLDSGKLHAYNYYFE